jgi:hypothetical protein
VQRRGGRERLEERGDREEEIERRGKEGGMGESGMGGRRKRERSFS